MFRKLAEDMREGRKVWRSVSPQFARYVRETMPPIAGPDGSDSYALGEIFDTSPRGGAIHTVIASEIVAGRRRHYAKLVNLMAWAEELLALRDALCPEDEKESYGADV